MRVLIVDDSPDDRFFTGRALQKTGLAVEIFEAEDGAEAIDYLSGQGRFTDPAACPKPELILLDLKMPGKNGFDVLRWLQAHQPGAPIKTVVLSGSELPGDVSLARELGAHAYLHKPATPDQLLGILS